MPKLQKSQLELDFDEDIAFAASDQTKVRLDLIPDKGQGEGSCIVTYNF